MFRPASTRVAPPRVFLKAALVFEDGAADEAADPELTARMASRLGHVLRRLKGLTYSDTLATFNLLKLPVLP